jgi:hypothetical protein
MNKIKRLLGLVWVLLGPAIIIYLSLIAFREIGSKPTTDTIIQWSVFLLISLPIGVGLVLFGWFAMAGEYNHLPQKSSELDLDETKDNR